MLPNNLLQNSLNWNWLFLPFLSGFINLLLGESRVTGLHRIHYRTDDENTLFFFGRLYMNFSETILESSATAVRVETVLRVHGYLAVSVLRLDCRSVRFRELSYRLENLLRGVIIG